MCLKGPVMSLATHDLTDTLPPRDLCSLNVVKAVMNIKTLLGQKASSTDDS